MSSATRWARGQTPPLASEPPQSRTPPGFSTHAVAPSDQREYVEHDWTYYPPFPLGGQKKIDGQRKEYGFAFFPKDFKEHLEDLAKIALYEEWGGKDDEGNFHRFELLRNYVKYSFKFIHQFIHPDHNHGEVQNDLFKKAGDWIVYDTRLVSTHKFGVKPIYALFRKNEERNKWEWRFHAWCNNLSSVNSPANANGAFETAPKPYDPRFSSTLPESWTEFDANYEWGGENLDHIVGDEVQFNRIKAVAGDLNDGMIGTLLTQAIEFARTPTLNPRRMLPQLYYDAKKSRFRQQLLMPLHLMQGKHADLALTLRIEKVRGKWTYYASTVLTIDMAYKNARIFHTVENPWLRRIAIDHDTSST